MSHCVPGILPNAPAMKNALIVLDITSMALAEQIQEIEMESPYGLTMIGDKLYVGEGENGLKIFDATDRRNAGSRIMAARYQGL